MSNPLEPNYLKMIPLDRSYITVSNLEIENFFKSLSSEQMSILAKIMCYLSSPVRGCNEVPDSAIVNNFSNFQKSIRAFQEGQSIRVN